MPVFREVYMFWGELEYSVFFWGYCMIKQEQKYKYPFHYASFQCVTRQFPTIRAFTFFFTYCNDCVILGVLDIYKSIIMDFKVLRV